MALAIGKKIGSTIKNIVDPNAKKKNKGKDFMHGLKEFVTSPGGILTIVLFVGVCWYVHHATSKKKAA
jgi:hypothetical protein